MPSGQSSRCRDIHEPPGRVAEPLSGCCLQLACGDQHRVDGGQWCPESRPLMSIAVMAAPLPGHRPPLLANRPGSTQSGQQATAWKKASRAGAGASTADSPPCSACSNCRHRGPFPTFSSRTAASASAGGSACRSPCASSDHSGAVGRGSRPRGRTLRRRRVARSPRLTSRANRVGVSGAAARTVSVSAWIDSSMGVPRRGACRVSHTSPAPASRCRAPRLVSFGQPCSASSGWSL